MQGAAGFGQVPVQLTHRHFGQPLVLMRMTLDCMPASLEFLTLLNAEVALAAKAGGVYEEDSPRALALQEGRRHRVMVCRAVIEGDQKPLSRIVTAILRLKQSARSHAAPPGVLHQSNLAFQFRSGDVKEIRNRLRRFHDTMICQHQKHPPNFRF
jgi:hypothetical protein